MQSIKEYLKYYIGQQAMFEKSGRVITIIAVYDAGIYDGVRHNPFDIYNFKPILKRITDITEEEMKGLWLLVFKKEFPQSGQMGFIKERTTLTEPRWILASGVSRMGIQMNGEVWADCDLHTWKHNQHEVTHYLISKGYWLFGDEAFDKGLIIDFKTLK